MGIKDGPNWGWQLGATRGEDGTCRFLVWAPKAEQVELVIKSGESAVSKLDHGKGGYFYLEAKNLHAGTRYVYRLDGQKERPDPASRYQPEGVHGPTEIVSAKFEWTDGNWRGMPLSKYVIYELHTGTFSEEGTFGGVISKLGYLEKLGITAVELMPVAQFPGSRNWGYDGVGLFAVQNSYGGPLEMKRLVNACHEHGLAVILDVVYNHLGPEGNYLGEFGHYFTEQYRTTWGPALNFDGPHSNEVRRFFLENALYWIREMHIDALRLDAVHAIRDFSAVPFLQELAAVVQRESERSNRRIHLIAESDLNAPRFVLPPAMGGYGLAAQWSDDFHHCLHVLLTGERQGYYSDFEGVRQFAKVWREGYAYTGDYSAHRKSNHGTASRGMSLRQFVVCAQNHDQVGNRMRGDRLSTLAAFEKLKLAAGAVLLSPFVPLLFMGEEYGEKAPFQYFVSHTEAELVEAVRKGRKEEFASFQWQGDVPDPQSEKTFQSSRLRPESAEQSEGNVLYNFYRALIELRRAKQVITEVEKDGVDTLAHEAQKVLVVRYRAGGLPQLMLMFNFSDESAEFDPELPGTVDRWTKVFDSEAREWGGSGKLSVNTLEAANKTMRLEPSSFAVYEEENFQ